jgi:hypothetical protein
MKNIYNILSDAFVEANMEESQFHTNLVHIHPRRPLEIQCTRKGTEKLLRIQIRQYDGYILNVDILENTLTEYTQGDCMAFIHSIHNQEQFYI